MFALLKVEEYRRLTVHKVESDPGIPNITDWKILTEKLEITRVCSKLLTAKQKKKISPATLHPQVALISCSDSYFFFFFIVTYKNLLSQH